MMLRFHHSNSLTKEKGKESPEAETKKRKLQQNIPQQKGHTEAAGTLWTLVHPYACFIFNPEPSI